MKRLPKSNMLIVLAIGSLLLGLVNYLLFRPHIILFSWLHMEHSSAIAIQSTPLSLFLRNYFSDITWCVALCFIVLALDEKRRLSLLGKTFILSLPFMSEFGQYLSLIPGTFDWLDILAYAVVILTINRIFHSKLIPIYMNMQKITAPLLVAGVFTSFLIMIFASAAPRHVYKAAPDPCVNHAGLNYSPILVQVNIDGSYTMKDLPGAQSSGQTYFFQALQNTSYGKYQLAQGVTPNLNIYITVNTDGYQHYGATVKLYVYDDNTWFNMASNYVDPAKLFDDIATKLNSFVAYGWKHGNCGTN